MGLTEYTSIAVVFVLISSFCKGEEYVAKCTIDRETGDTSVPIEGELTLRYDDIAGQTTITGRISGFNRTDDQIRHGFHIHAEGLLTNACTDAGGHFNPLDVDHGGPTSSVRHIGDLGNIDENGAGTATVDITDSMVKLDGTNNVVGKAIVVHAIADDLVSQPTGAAGGRLGCCIITLQNGVSSNGGRKGGRKDGKKNGRKDGRKGGRKGRKNGRKEDRYLQSAVVKVLARYFRNLQQPKLAV